MNKTFIVKLSDILSEPGRIDAVAPKPADESELSLDTDRSIWVSNHCAFRAHLSPNNLATLSRDPLDSNEHTKPKVVL